MAVKCPQCQGNNFKWAKRCAHCGHGLLDPEVTAPAPAAGGARIRTMSGPNISLTPATSAQLDAFRVCWPFGLEAWPGANGKHGLICRRPDREMMRVKFQQVDVPLAVAQLVRFQ